MTNIKKNKTEVQKKSVNSNYNWDAEVVHGNAATGEQYWIKRDVRSDTPITYEEMKNNWNEMDKEAENLRKNHPGQVISAISYQDTVGNQVIRFTPNSELIFPVGVPIYDESGKQIIGKDNVRAEVERRREEWARWEREGKLAERVEVHHTDDGKTVSIKFRAAPKRIHQNEVNAGTAWLVDAATEKRKGQLGIENNQELSINNKKSRTEENEDSSQMEVDKTESSPVEINDELLTDEQIEKASKEELKKLSKRIKSELERRKTEQSSSNYQVSSQKLEQQLHKAEAVLNSFSNSTDNSPSPSSILPTVGVIGVIASLFGGLIIWKKNTKVKK